MSPQSFHIDLTDINACGVYMVGIEDLDTVDAAATRDDFNVHHVDLLDCRDRAAVTRRLAEGFSLPDRYGDDWSTLVEYLEEMGGLPSRGHVLLLRHTEHLREADPAELDHLLDTLEDTAAIWAGEGVAFFVFTGLPPHMQVATKTMANA